MKSANLIEHLKGQDCVLSALGAPGTYVFSSCKVYTESMESIVSAMRKAGLKRLICITAMYTKRN